MATNDDLMLAYLRSKGAEIIDKRTSGGCLWVVYESRIESHINESRKWGVYFNLSAQGGRASGYRKAWYTKQYAKEAQIKKTSEIIGEKKAESYSEEPQETKTLPTVVEPYKDNVERICRNCMLYRRYDCAGGKEICEDYRGVPAVDEYELQSRPKYGDATAIKEGEHTRNRRK